jgi:outer membrane protein TolC
MRRTLTLLLLLLSLSATAQTQVLTEEAFLQAIRRYHPLARLAGLEVERAAAAVTSSRGAFDPVFRHTTGRKDFDGVTYYNQRINELELPTWYGVELVAGTETVTGNFINPEKTKGALNYVGISLPVAQGLLMDKRRAALQQARLFQQQSEQDRLSAVNALVAEGLKAYWDWWQFHEQLTLVEAALQNAERRQQLVTTAWKLGDRPAIDTLEALTQVQSLAQRRTEIYSEMLQARIELSLYLWRENNQPYDLPAGVQPQPWSRGPELALDSLLTNGNVHPDLIAYDFKLRALRVEQQLKFQSLLPKIDLKYNQLGKDYNFGKTLNNAWFENNFRFGVSVAVPLRLSEGRGDYRQATIKLEQARLEQNNKRVLVLNKIRQSYVAWQQLANQLGQQVAMVTSYAALQRGEETKFFNGESSLFLINSRELKTLEARQKLVELQSKDRKARVSLLAAAAGFAAE